MRVLLLTQFYWPEMRTAPNNLAAMATDLHGKGHEILVITGFPNHPHGRIYDGYRMKLWQWDELHGVRILRLPLLPDHSISKVRRVLNYGSFALSAITLGIFQSHGFIPDVIFAYYAPLTMGVTAAGFKFLLKAPLAYWITDLWPENLQAAGVRLKERAYGMIRAFEDWGYRQADMICVDSPGFKSNLIDKGVPTHKVHVVPEWADEHLFFPEEPNKILAQEYGLAHKFNVIYGGNLGTVQGLGVILEAALHLQDLKDLQFVFIGDGNDMENLKRQSVVYGLANVKFISRQPMEKIQKFFALANVLLVHLKRKAIFELQLPSKIIAYMACGRPILCAVPGAAAKIVRDAGAGVFCPSEDAEAMSAQVRELHSMPTEKRENMGKNGRKAFLSKYTRQASVNKIESILLSMVNGL